jgi:hypothetical protein
MWWDLQTFSFLPVDLDVCDDWLPSILVPTASNYRSVDRMG